ncbi:MAG TPA: aldose epimerase family protein [Solirubrobacteraceae bacterium]|nr:aldose epimerase family protein [Solirubrobacteraceae bacterium]
MSVTSEPWGEVEGQPIELYTLSSPGGLTVSVSSYGGVVQSIWVPDRSGRRVNVALGFSTLREYVANTSGADGSASGGTHFGALIGRYANRIADHSFVLDGHRYELAGNNGPGNAVTLHGGPGGGYSGRVWEAAPGAADSDAAVRLRYVDPDGANGFPGTVENVVEYAVTRDNALRIEYRLRTDAPTVVSPSNHTYFNLAGEGSGDVYDQLLAVNAHVMQPISEIGIPTGFTPVAGTPFDFRAMKPIGRDLRSAGAPGGEQLALAWGYDHNWVLRGSGYRLAAVACDPGSGIGLWTYTDRPGVQVYTSNHLAGDLVGTSGRCYRPGDAFALETQLHPDAPNHLGDPGWPDPVLRPGRLLVSRTTYRFTVAGTELPGRIQF